MKLIFIVKWVFHSADVLRVSIISCKYGLIFSRYFLIVGFSSLLLVYSIYISSKMSAIFFSFSLMSLGMLRVFSDLACACALLFCLGERGWASYQIYKKGGEGLTRSQFLEGGCSASHNPYNLVDSSEIYLIWTLAHCFGNLFI